MGNYNAIVMSGIGMMIMIVIFGVIVDFILTQQTGTGVLSKIGSTAGLSPLVGVVPLVLVGGILAAAATWGISRMRR